MNLYELSASLNTIYQLIEENDGELTEPLETMLDATEADFHKKLENIGKLMLNLDAEIAGFKNEEKRLAISRQVKENLKEKLKAYVKEAMEETKNTKVKLDTFTFCIQKNPPSLNIVAREKIPGEYFIELEPKLDSQNLLSDLKAGVSIPGAELENAKTHLRQR